MQEKSDITHRKMDILTL